MKAVVRIKTAPELKVLSTYRNVVPWGAVSKAALLEDVEALLLISRHKDCSAQGSQLLKKRVQELAPDHAAGGGK